MKAKTFENLIRKVVREEIDYALRREIRSLKEDLQNENKSQIVEQKPILQKSNTLKKEIFTKKHVQPQNFTSNNALNDLLNETAQGDTNLDRGNSPVSMEDDFSTVGGIPVEAVPEEVQNAVTRDYSSLMKAIDKRNKNQRP